MATITGDSTLLEVAVVVSEALEKAGITATLSGGGAVSIYSDNIYQSFDLDFVTAAMAAELAPVLEQLGFQHTPGTRAAQFEHPLVDWYLDFRASPLTFGSFEAGHEDCTVISLPAGRLRIITPTQSVMDRLAAAFEWRDPQSRDQAVLVAANNAIEWEILRRWFADEGYSETEYERFRNAAEASPPDQ